MYIHAYNKDGVMISEGDESFPFTVGPLNVSENEVSAPQPLIIKTEAGFSTLGDTIITFVGENAAKWSISETEDGTFTNELTITDLIDSVGKTVYVKASATEDEVAQNDKTVDISLSATIQAVD